MIKTTRLIIGIPLCFTLLVAWFAWSAYRAAPPLAAEALRGAGLSIATAIEQLTVVDPTLQSLARYATPDIAYVALIDRQGKIRYHTNADLIGHQFTGAETILSHNGISEQRERLGTGEEVYILRTHIHSRHDEYLLVLALHTYRADQVIRRSTTGVTVVATLTAALWVLTVLILYMLRREQRHHREMQRREELARLGEMGAVLAHEIRNPLAGIKGYAQLVESAADLGQTRTFAGKIVAQSLRLEALVNDLLAFARDDQDEQQIVDLSRLIAESVALMDLEAASQQVMIETELQSPVSAYVNPDRIMQLLLNLLKNAFQAMPDGGQLTIGLRQKKGKTLIRVKDTGIGISPEHLPKIFEPFWTSKITGTGLGLSLCKKVAEEHGGSLTVASTVGVGTEFVLTLPATT
jgi:two-component system sensor histidine kinase HydH